MVEMKFVRHDNLDFPVFTSLNSAASFLSSKYSSFDLHAVFPFDDYFLEDDIYYWFYQFVFSYHSELFGYVSDSLVFVIPDFPII